MANEKSVESLLHVLRETNPGNPKFVIFLGAGASVSSGVKSGTDLVQQWRGVFNSNHRDHSSPVEKQVWYNTPSEYGKLFESIYPVPALRRDFIEKCIKDASPSWGYLYLADLIQEGYFDTILTTNFDDLVNDACIMFSRNLRPLVCSHDASINLFRLNASRPKVIKLHGDYLFDNIKNTAKEVASLEDNTRSKIERLAEDFGLIVMGYGGNDESVMSCIGEFLRTKTNYPHGIYWCTRDTGKLSDRLRAFSEDSRFYFVQIDSFDGIMADVHEALIGKSPAIITDPLGVVSERLSKLLRGLEVPSINNRQRDALTRDFNLLARNIKTDEANAITIDLPTGFVGAMTFSRGEYEKATKILLQDFLVTKAVRSLVLLFECLRHKWDDAVCDQLFDRMQSAANARQQYVPQFYLNATLSLIHAKQYDRALTTCDMGDIAFKLHGTQELADFNSINRCQIVLHKGGRLNVDQEFVLKEVLQRTTDPKAMFGCNVLLGDHRKATEIVKENRALFENSTSDWPIVQLMPRAEANELIELVGTGTGHLGGMNIDFKIETAPR